MARAAELAGGGFTPEEGEHLLLQLREGIGGRGGVDVVDHPIVHAVLPGGELASHQRPVLGLLEGDDAVGAGEIAVRERNR